MGFLLRISFDEPPGIKNMLDDDSILELYYEFQKDINDSVVFPRLSIKRSKEKWCYCRIEYTDNLDVSLILGLDFGLQTSP